MENQVTPSTSADVNPTGDDTRSTARWIAWTIIAIGFAAQLSRIVQVQSSTGEMPFHSANDRSRWCTIAALAVTGKYEIDDVLAIRDPETRRRTWYSIDLVKHRGQDGKQHFYSSKPPLLPTLYTGVYLGIRAATGITLMKEPFVVVPLMLVVVNLIPLAFFWWIVACWSQNRGLSPWATAVTMAFLVGGCFLSTFANTLNNHLPGAIAVGLSLYCISRIVEGREHRPLWFILCGLCTSFGAANELPALSWVAAAGGILAILNFRYTMLAYVPALLPVAVAFFAANYAAHGEWKPAYAHRNLGEQLATLEKEESTWDLEKLQIGDLRERLAAADLQLSPTSQLRKARREGVYELWDPETQSRLGLQEVSDDILRVHEWGDWYDYPESYWTSDKKQGVDRGEPNRAKYIFHSLLGHHGILSLTPFWWIAVLGGGVVWRRRQTWNFFVDHRLLIMLAIVATSVVSIGFYLARPVEDCNYGGVSSGFRWAFWLSPLWIWLCMEALAVVKAGWLRAATIILLAASVFSATYPWDNPWTSPWAMHFVEWLAK